MTVKGGLVRIHHGPLYTDPENVGYPPKMYATISVIADFPEDMPEIIRIIHKRLIEAQCKINLEIEGILEADE